MIKFVLGTELWMYPLLARTMFQDRAHQFSSRLNWDVDVDAEGFERDQYDQLNPIYVLFEGEKGEHSGSMRLLPTTGRTMINDYFSSALRDGPIQDPKIWECTRFCLSPKSGPEMALKLFAGVARLAHEFDVSSLVGAFDGKMLRKYRLSGVSPEVLGEAKLGGTRVMTGKWDFDVRVLDSLIAKAKLDSIECELALANSCLLTNQWNWSTPALTDGFQKMKESTFHREHEESVADMACLPELSDV